MQQTLMSALIAAMLTAAYVTPAVAAPAKADASNTCEVVTRSNGQFIRQTAGTAGEISAYTDGKYTTYIPRKNRLYYVTADTDAVVRGYDADGLVC